MPSDSAMRKQLSVKAIGSGLHAIAGLIQGGEDTPDVFLEQASRAGQLRAAGGANE